jgi:arylsulfatase A-like enzyme
MIPLLSRRRGAILAGALAASVLLGWLLVAAARRGTHDAAAAGVPAGLLREDGGRLPDVVLLTVDTLRADHVYGVAPSTWHLTPNLERLASRGTIFTGTRAPAPATKPGLAGLMSGSYVHRHGVASNFGSVLPTAPLLADLLQRQGYATAAFVGNGVLNERSGLQRGFGRFTSFVDKTKLSNDASGVDQAIAWLATAPREPWLLWLHLMSPHGPYNSAPRVKSAEELPDPLPDVDLTPSQSNYGLGPIIPRYQLLAMPPRSAGYRSRYRDEVLFVDGQIGRFLDALEKGGHGSAVVIVTADHGESLGDGDYFFQHGWLANEASLHVPMIWSKPGRIAQGHRVDASTSLVDVLPTLLAGLDVKQPTPALDGRDLTATLRGGATADEVVFALSAYPNQVTTALRGTWKVVHTPAPPRPLPRDHWHDFYPTHESWALYDLKKDPLETRDVAAERPQAFAELRDRLLAWERTNGVPSGTRAAPQVDPATAEGLRALGYLD